MFVTNCLTLMSHCHFSFRRTENDCKIEVKRSALAPAYSTSVGSIYGTNGAQNFPTGRCGPDNGEKC